MVLKVILIAVVLIGLALAGIGIKMFLKKDGKFEKHCSSVDSNGKRIGCVCGDDSGAKCENKHKHHE